MKKEYLSPSFELIIQTQHLLNAESDPEETDIEVRDDTELENGWGEAQSIDIDE